MSQLDQNHSQTPKELISASQILSTLASGSTDFVFLDVRSESEFADAHIRGFCNLPILTDQERHLVGTCYKQKGQAAAFELGYQLTLPHKKYRVEQWLALAGDRQLIICCWRGGARSRIACEWLAEAGLSALRVRGGYKAMRQLLRARLENPPALYVLSGATGVGKTSLLRELPTASVDLESCAHHRGSAFGECGAQPTQTQFENDVALTMWLERGHYLLEDESRLIGKVEIPLPLKNAMYAAPVLLLEEAIELRVRNIFAEYVEQPLKGDCSAECLMQRLTASLGRIQQKLGDQRYRRILDLLQQAFSAQPARLEAHQAWITELLRDYYDPRYLYSFERQQRRILVRGNAAQLREYVALNPSDFAL